MGYHYAWGSALLWPRDTGVSPTWKHQVRQRKAKPTCYKQDAVGERIWKPRAREAVPSIQSALSEGAGEAGVLRGSSTPHAPRVIFSSPCAV